MAQARTYKKMKKTTVQLTSLLDLLFVMIFVSLIQNKTLDVKVQTKTKEPKPQTSPVVKTKVKKKTTQLVNKGYSQEFAKSQAEKEFKTDKNIKISFVEGGKTNKR